MGFMQNQYSANAKEQTSEHKSKNSSLLNSKYLGNRKKKCLFFKTQTNRNGKSLDCEIALAVLHDLPNNFSGHGKNSLI